MNKGAKKTLIRLVVAVPLMFAFGFALVPLYDVFCEVTGINGKVFQSEHSEDLMSDDGRSIALQFISTNNENMPWTFKPSEQVMKIETGKYHLQAYTTSSLTCHMCVSLVVLPSPGLIPS
jgi:cytochrome c oxidase assembly protein subunit 11